MTIIEAIEFNQTTTKGDRTGQFVTEIKLAKPDGERGDLMEIVISTENAGECYGKRELTPADSDIASYANVPIGKLKCYFKGVSINTAILDKGPSQTLYSLILESQGGIEFSPDYARLPNGFEADIGRGITQPLTSLDKHNSFHKKNVNEGIEQAIRPYFGDAPINKL